MESEMLADILSVESRIGWRGIGIVVSVPPTDPGPREADQKYPPLAVLCTVEGSNGVAPRGCPDSEFPPHL